MRDETPIIIPIPQSKSYKTHVLLNEQDMTQYVQESYWTKQATIGTGIFRLTIVNTNGQYSDTFTKGQTAKFYADNTNGTTLQFWGRIDYLKDKISKEGQFLEIEGRHRSYRISETKVCYSTTDKEISQILKEIIDANLTGFTYVNTQTTTINTSVTWNYKPFWECVRELCKKAERDCYVDDTLDFHFFPANSIVNDNEAVANDNFLKNEDVGTDDFYEKTRVTAMGHDDQGMPIIYTAISPNEGDEIREEFIKDTSANTEAQVQAMAEGKLADLLNRPPQGKFYTYLLKTLQPGDNIPFILPRQKIFAYYKVMEFTHKFGSKTAPIQTEIFIEKQIGSNVTLMQDRIIKEGQLQEADNPNKLSYSYNFVFDDESKVAVKNDVVIADGVLRLAASKTTGSLTSITKNVANTITQVEFRYVGKDLATSAFDITCNGNISRFTGTKRTMINVVAGDQGKNIGIKVTLNQDNTNPDPQIDSLAIFYS